MKILIVYEEIPETTKFYIEDVAPQDWDWMRLTHGYFANTIIKDKTIEKAVTALGDWLVDKQALEFDTPIGLTGIDYVLHTGFVL